jgi:hypothetical protein
MLAWPSRLFHRYQIHAVSHEPRRKSVPEHMPRDSPQTRPLNGCGERSLLNLSPVIGGEVMTMVLLRVLPSLVSLLLMTIMMTVMMRVIMILMATRTRVIEMP